MSNSGFLLTDAGLADAGASSPSGPYFHINSFRVGSGVNYTPTRDMTALVGTVLYTGTPQTYSIVDEDTVDVLLVMDNTVGPFDFGEIGLYSNSNTLLAVLTFTELQNKVRAVGNQAGNIWRIHARMKLAQAPVIVTVTVLNSMTLLEVPNWQSLAAPINQLMGANAAIVHEQNVSGDSVLVVREGDLEWATLGYGKIFEGNTTDSGSSASMDGWAHPGLANVFFEFPSSNSRYLARFPDGSIRRVVGQSMSTDLQWSPQLGVAPVGHITIWEDSTTLSSGLPVASAYEYNILATDINRYWAAPTGSAYPTNNAGINEVPVPLLTTRPSAAQWGHVGDTLRRLMYLLSTVTGSSSGGIPVSDIVNSDFVARPANPMVPGVATLTELYDKYRKAILGLDAIRNTVNPSFLEMVGIPGATRTRTLPFVNLVDFNVNFQFGGVNALNGQANSGGALVITSTSSNSNVFYTAWHNFFNQIGSIIIDRGSCFSSNGFGTPGNGILNATPSGSGTLVYSASVFSAPLASTLWYRVYSRRDNVTGVFLIDIQLQIVGSVSYSYTTPGSLTHTVNLRRASSALIFTPVQPIPSVSTGGNF
jgi:hypothetical protein